MSPRILVIDDSLTIRKLVSMALTEARFDVKVAASGREGLAEARQAPPDLILLDFRLPDLTAEDICAQLAGDEATRKIPLILMSARDDDVRPTMKSGAHAVDFVSKPFTGPAVAARVAKALGIDQAAPVNGAASTPAAPAGPSPPTGAPAAAASPSVPGRRPEARPLTLWPFAQKEQLAKILFARLRAKLGKVPEWLQKGDGADPAVAIARRLFTPDTVDMLIDALTPLFEERLRAAPTTASAATMTGTTEIVPLPVLLKTLADLERDGELLLEHDGTDTRLFLRRGAVVCVTTTSVARYLEGTGLEVARLPAAAAAQAVAEQSRTGKPVPVSAAEAGCELTPDLPAFLQRRGLQLLTHALERSASFTFKPFAPVPAFVETYSRHVSLEQIQLETLREATVIRPQAVALANKVLRRAEGFTRKMRQLQLDPLERRLLSLLDGRTTTRQLLLRVPVQEELALAALFRLLEVGLLAVSASGVSEARAVDVAVVTHGSSDLPESLRAGISTRCVLREFRVLQGLEGLTAMDGPVDLLVICAANGAANGAANAEWIRDLVKVAKDKKLVQSAIVAIAERFEPGDEQALYDIGVDATMVSPVHIPTLCGLA